MVFIEDHLSNVRVKDVFNYSDRLACACVPNLYVPLACHKDFKTLLAEECPADCLVICVVWDKGPLVLEDSECASTCDQSTMLGDSSNALDLVSVLHVEGLHAAVVKDVPHFDHSLEISRDKTVQIRQTVDAD